MKIRLAMLATCFTFIAFFILSAFAFQFSYAEKVKTVEGLIEYASKDYISVRGKNYYISNTVLLLNPSGKKLDKSELKTGRKVNIFFNGSTITSVVIYDRYAVE